MESILFSLGEKITEGTILLMVLWWLSKRIGQVETTVDRKLNNGIGSRLTSIEKDVAYIKGKVDL